MGEFISMIKRAEERWDLVVAEAESDPEILPPGKVMDELLEEAMIVAVGIKLGLIPDATSHVFGSLCMAYQMGQRHAIQIPELFKGALDND